jgi:hypothetical protein
MSILSDLTRSDREDDVFGRYAVLLASLVTLLLALPVFRNTPGGSVRFSILLSLVLIAAIYVNSVHRWLLILGTLLGGSAIAATAIGQFAGSEPALLVARSLGLGLLVMTTLLMLASLMLEDRVSRDTILGGICVYLLIGLCYAMAFLVALSLDPGALLRDGAPLGAAGGAGSERSAHVLYFSFVTLTTLGFGDIAPSGELTQTLTVAEATTGQLYVAIFIARLVGLYLAAGRKDRESAAVPQDERGDS